ncbi:hypothetical protein HOG21_02360 [bacterium]|jgi:hypothetical protein|nr:hypothetical protein [bacterium]
MSSFTILSFQKKSLTLLKAVVLKLTHVNLSTLGAIDGNTIRAKIYKINNEIIT